MRTYTEKPEGAAGYPVYRCPLSLDPASPEIVAAPAVLADPIQPGPGFFFFNMHAGDLTAGSHLTH